MSDILNNTPTEDSENISEQALSQAETTETVEAVEKKPAYRSAHNTASAASLNIEGEEVDIRRQTAKKRKTMKAARISYENKKKLYGYGFISIWLVGMVWLFLSPLFSSIHFSLSNTKIVSAEVGLKQYGMTGAGVYLEWVGLQNYIDAFTLNKDYLKNLTSSLGQMLPQVFLILVFSLFIAVILNQKFKGRTFVRAIFFLPVLIATGPVISVINGDLVAQQGVASAEQFSSLFKTDLVDELLTFLGLVNINPQFTDFISTITSDIFNLIWNSGIQILIFLAALQNIPSSAKEAASMEGATAWEFFWKITLPYISPMILANIIYSVIDAFIDPQNPVMTMVVQQTTNWKHGVAASFAWIYFAIVLAALGIVVLIVNRFVYYEVD